MSKQNRKTQTIDIGATVLCDICSEDYTLSAESGGILILSKAVCPKCTPKWEAEAVFIRGRCPAGKSFADWVRQDLRGGKPGVIIITEG